MFAPSFLVDTIGETPESSVPAANGDLMRNKNKELSNKMVLKHQADSGACWAATRFHAVEKGYQKHPPVRLFRPM